MLDLLRAKMPWPDLLFKDFIPSGFALLAVNGLPQLLAALMLFKKHPWACQVTLACGILLMLWIVLEWWIWGFVALSNIYFVLGLVEAVVALFCLRKEVGNRAIYNYLNIIILKKSGFQTPVATSKTTEITR